MATKTFLHGKPIDDAVEVHEHVSPQMTYVKVLGALFVLTGLTYAVSYASLGAASLYVAMGVAFVKATLVCMFFMHLKYDDRFHVFAFLSTIIFVTIFFLFTMFDLQSRTRLNEEQGTMFRIEYGGDWNDAKSTNKAEVHGPEEIKGVAEGKAEGKQDAKAQPKAPDPAGKAEPNKRP
ncbi:MAG TPA: cytochrome C oxidase subunit IV family protein [Nannocystaceae bacterium]|nr:cytochrome C oxidase subunit IV family protein [Nannocystaceae bacterium]